MMAVILTIMSLWSTEYSCVSCVPLSSTALNQIHLHIMSLVKRHARLDGPFNQLELIGKCSALVAEIDQPKFRALPLGGSLNWKFPDETQ
jgi:hypothetical protein